MATVESENSEVPIDLMVKQHGGAMYMFAVGMRDGMTTATFRVGNITKGKKVKVPGENSTTIIDTFRFPVRHLSNVEVLGENRTIVVNDDSFNDHFDPWDVHLYRLSYESKR